MKDGVTRRTAAQMAVAGLITAQSSSTYAQRDSTSTLPEPKAGLKTLIAVAVGSRDNDHEPINTPDLTSVRPYIRGLVNGLTASGLTLNSHYKILYRERPVSQLNDESTYQADGAVKPIIFCMSTSVVGAAKKFISKTPVVAVVSDPKREQIHKRTNICGISARRSQTAGECFSNFMASVPSLAEIYVLYKEKYNPSEAALKVIQNANDAPDGPAIPLTKCAINVEKDIDDCAQKWVARAKTDEPARGVLVLPVDILLANAAKIIRLAQGKYLPTFFPITDWVKATSTQDSGSALGGYGVSQESCGNLMASQVAHIWANYDDANNQMPKPRWRFASTVEWVTSPAAYEYLGIEVPDDVPTLL